MGQYRNFEHDVVIELWILRLLFKFGITLRAVYSILIWDIVCSKELWTMIPRVVIKKCRKANFSFNAQTVLFGIVPFCYLFGATTPNQHEDILLTKKYSNI